MGTINNVNGVSAQWEPYGYAFNPYPIYVQTTERCTIRLRVYQHQDRYRYNIPIDRDPIAQPGETIYKTIFDISGVSRLFFDDDLSEIQFIDDKLRVPVQINIYKIMPGTTNEIYIGGMVNIVDWGGLQIGQTYNVRDTYIYWKGLPFTVPLTILYQEENIVPVQWYERIDEGTYSSRGVLGVGKYNLNITGIATTAKRRIVWRFGTVPIDNWTGIFTREFDQTFRGIDDGTFFINIRVAECVREGIYLRWVSPLGEWLYFNFDIASRSKVTTNNSITIEPDYTTVHPDNTNGYAHPGTGVPISKNGQETITAVANLIEPDIFDYVNTLETSPLIYMYDGVSESGATKWIRVDVAAGTFVRSGSHLQDLTFNVLMPRDLLQSL